jgi:hypothetical protein
MLSWSEVKQKFGQFWWLEVDSDLAIGTFSEIIWCFQKKTADYAKVLFVIGAS